MNGALKLSNGRTVPVNETIVRYKSSLAMPAFALLRQIEEVLNVTLADVQLMGVNLRFVHSDALEAGRLQSVRWNGAMHAGDKSKCGCVRNLPTRNKRGHSFTLLRLDAAPMT